MCELCSCVWKPRKQAPLPCVWWRILWRVFVVWEAGAWKRLGEYPGEGLSRLLPSESNDTWKWCGWGGDEGHEVRIWWCMALVITNIRWGWWWIDDDHDDHDHLHHHHHHKDSVYAEGRKFWIEWIHIGFLIFFKKTFNNSWGKHKENRYLSVILCDKIEIHSLNVYEKTYSRRIH